MDDDLYNLSLDLNILIPITWNNKWYDYDTHLHEFSKLVAAVGLVGHQVLQVTADPLEYCTRYRENNALK